MRIAVFYPNPRVGCAWSLSHGLVDGIKRMGHEVLPCPVNTADLPEKATTKFPSQAVLWTCDAIIVSGLEHLTRYLHFRYKLSMWKTLPAPKIIWFHESLGREDVTPFNSMKEWGTHFFFPSEFDADALGGTFLPFAADTEVFKPMNFEKVEFDSLFVGVMYGMRGEYLKKLSPLLKKKDISFEPYTALVYDTKGNIKIRETAEAYVTLINRANIFLNLPSMSVLHVSKVVEVMACGGVLLTPFVEQLDKRAPATYLSPYGYNPDDMTALISLLGTMKGILSQYPETIERYRNSVVQDVLTNHKIEHRIEKMIEVAGK